MEEVKLLAVDLVREKIIDNTPTDYSNLYEKCWSSDQNQRPKILTELERNIA
ncbi:hypothetical protein C2G38_2183604 [Gigaspora rosea]|uniref:Serine-threonine/tyrosine-protein kinase catalytic domain-containing protein n=1 Tax=Gigaspora rosea TaxID=44941 RepID=A0A397V8P6_9GLOM|nr:hypothetical protein C2G38_2183604 [Gigaspora rosea]